MSIELFPGKSGFATKIMGNMNSKVEAQVIACLQRNADIFAFKPADLKRIDPKIAVHILHEDPSIKLVK